jgi:hypothetical protein
MEDEPVQIPDKVCGVEVLWQLEGWVEIPTGDIYLAYIVQEEPTFYLIDPQTGQCYHTQSQPFYRATNAPQDGLQLSVYPVDDDVTLMNAAGEPILTLADPFSHLSRNKRFTLHPDGMALATYHRLQMDSENDITIWQQDGTGAALEIETLEPGNLVSTLPELAWGNVGLVLPEDAILTPIGTGE